VTGKMMFVHPLPAGKTIGSEEYAIFVGGPIIGSSKARRRNRSTSLMLFALIDMAVTPVAM
jgi:hypothetical protein